MTTIITNGAWNDVYADEDGLAPRLTTVIELTLTDGFVRTSHNLRLVAINVTGLEASRGEITTQEAVNAEDADDLAAIYGINGEDGPIQPAIIRGRSYVIVGTLS